MCPNEIEQPQPLTPKALLEAVQKLMQLVAVQNEKIEHLSHIVEGKASTQSVTQIAETIEVLIAELRQKLDTLDHHHHDTPVTKSFQEMVDSGEVTFHKEAEMFDGAVIMAIMHQGSILLFSIEEHAGRQMLAPIDTEDSIYTTAIHNLLINAGWADSTPAYISINVYSSEPLNEHSVKVVPVENTIE